MIGTVVKVHYMAISSVHITQVRLSFLRLSARWLKSETTAPSLRRPGCNSVRITKIGLHLPKLEKVSTWKHKSHFYGPRCVSRHSHIYLNKSVNFKKKSTIFRIVRIGVKTSKHEIQRSNRPSRSLVERRSWRSWRCRARSRLAGRGPSAFRVPVATHSSRTEHPRLCRSHEDSSAPPSSTRFMHQNSTICQ